jgi:hypothetical protein
VRHLGIVFPLQRTGRRVHRAHDAPLQGHVHHAVDDERCGFLAAVGIEVHPPGGTQAADGVGIDLRQRTEALLLVIAPMAHPVARLGVGGGQPGGIDRGGVLGVDQAAKGGECEQEEELDATSHVRVPFAAQR